MNEEYKSMQDNQIWNLVPLPEGKKPIDCKWIFKIKRNLEGNVERYKARLVAKSFTQREGIDFTETLRFYRKALLGQYGSCCTF